MSGLRKQYVNHTPSETAKKDIERLRERVDILHTVIEETAPYPSRERSLALTKLEECLMWAVKGIVLNDPNATPAQPVAK